jgi:pimeloyl-ACP methyl ester carboxylesterase
MMAGQKLWAGPYELWIVRGLSHEEGHNKKLIAQIKSRLPEVVIKTFDYPGIGLNWREEAYSRLSDYTQFQKNLFLQKSSPQLPKILLGFSFGGMVAIDWLNLHPEDFERVIAVNTSLNGVCSIFERLNPKNLHSYMNMLLVSSMQEKEEIIFNIIMNDPDKKNLINDWAHIKKTRPVSFLTTLKQVWAAAHFKTPAKIKTSKLLLLASEQDHMVDFNCSQKIAQYYQVPLYRHPVAGHDLANDDPEWLVERIKEVMKTTSLAKNKNERPVNLK